MSATGLAFDVLTDRGALQLSTECSGAFGIGFCADGHSISSSGSAAIDISAKEVERTPRLSRTD